MSEDGLPVASSSPPSKPVRERFMALDLLRGFDMLFLCVGVPMISAAAQAWGFDSPWLRRQLSHPDWIGFSCLDLVMPMFIFMCGAAVPFALRKRLGTDGRATWAFWRHVAGRVALLWVLGMVAQGRLLEFDLAVLSPFNNTLQTIACGYAIAALALLIRRRWLRVALPFALAAAYTLAFAIAGNDYTPDGNVAIRFEEWFVKLVMPAANRAFEIMDPHYTWWFTIPMYGAMTLCGFEATEILRSDRPAVRRAATVAGLGAALLLGGLALEWLGIPCVKHVFTASFTAQAMGWCLGFYALLFTLTDILRVRRGWWLVTLFGETALAAYMLGEVFPGVLYRAAELFTVGILPRFPESRGFILATVASATLTFALWVWRRARRASEARGCRAGV